MNALTLAALVAFWTQYPDAETPLRAWYKQVRAREYGSFAEVKADFASADWVEGFIVFDIGGNKYRLIVEPNFDGQRFYVEAVLTHKQYDAWRP
ncbi:type II toxin-antitoxin system HigB family toxin [Deinococcus sp.]|uniref:type II toxin-antitoxin system HigB family toxin n=1 Tax=Deinococcus sp. TaxID=47478 RepID=UPI0025D84E2D|nr:type II toxin-antitoxin system HigB family toxin [Deinococcus sp.]